ncbi:response regulator [Bacillus sp. 03113]|uniref:response regulator n=1 Tax=Bacillus sp. 03113 TaxID=2578211 RepID=UPI0011444048|nr:response regulator [Bacillus sp. 03113]
MKFKTKLFSGLGSILILTTILLVILLNMINQLTVNMSVVISELTERIKLASTVQYEINNMGRELMEISSNPPNDILPQIINNWEQSRNNINSSIDALKEKDTRKQSQEIISKFKTLYTSYENTGQEIMTYQQMNQNGADFDKLLWGNARQNQERMQQMMDLLYSLQEQEMKDELFRTRQTYYSTVKKIYIYVISGFLVGVGIIIWFITGMTKNLNRVTSVMTKIAYHKGERFPRIKVTSKDEVGAIANAYNEMAKVLEEHGKQEKELKEKAEEHSWLKTKVAEITSKYPSAEDFQTLAHSFIKDITPMVGAETGIFYIKEKFNEKQVLKKIASYALFDQKHQFDSFEVGEGLVGQCALEKKSILLSEIPENYLQITSGVGKSPPNKIMIIPAEFEGEILAVVEIATFKDFSPLQQRLLQEVIEHIGITINSIRNRMQVKKLLQDSQALTEELQSQSEELQLQQEQLRSINEELEEQNKNSEQKKKELEEAGVLLEEKAQQLSQSSKFKSEFLANMSHELRTPLNSLLILAQMLMEKGSENLTPKQKEYLRTIYSSGNDLLYLINDILDLSKVESGKLEVISGEVVLTDIKSFAESQFLPIAHQKGLEFDVILESNLPEMFHTDEHRLNQILNNLLSNAFKFTEKGSISLIIQKSDKIDYEEIQITSQKESMLAFTVVDTGIGIPKEKQKMIFDTFKQADGTTSRKYGGTGLGLAISREIAKLLGGYIIVNSVEGVGSSFTLYLPNIQISNTKENLFSMQEMINDLISVEAASAELFDFGIEQNLLESNIPNGSMLLNGTKILIVDDDIRNIFALTAALEDYNMEVIFAKNGLEGIEVLLENQDTDIVLMDIMMPEMDGLETMRKIRNMEEFQTLPIIALTAKAMKHNRDECIEAGASDYISKPINIEQLLSLIQVWLYR